MSRQKKTRLTIYCVIFTVLVLVLVGVLYNLESLQNLEEEIAKAPVETTTVTEATTAEVETTTVDNTLHEVSLIAVGDDLISDSIIHCGLEDDGSYNFDELFKDVKGDIESADIAVINQETMLGGPDFPYTGYPCFNSPYEVGDAAIAAGFDVFLQATNHSFDVGVKGIENCIAYYKKHPEVTMIGLNKSQKAQDRITIVEKNGIKIAMLNYTYGLNGFVLPEDQPYLVNLIDEAKIKKDLKRARKKADFVIVFPHWGIEYTHTPTDEQVSLAHMMVANGADLIIGTHPHVVEGIEWIEEKGHKALCYYSLGNFTSTQDQIAPMLGGMAKLTIAKQGDNVYIEDGAGIVPLATHYEWGSGRYTNTYYLRDYTDDMARSHSINTILSGFSATALQEISQEVLGDWVIE